MDASSALQAQAPAEPRAGVRLSRLQVTIALTALAMAVRCLDIASRPLWLDEAFSGWFAACSWHYLWTVVPTFEAHPPFYYSILKLWTALSGTGAVALRSLSLLFGVAAVPVVIAAALEQEKLEPSGRPLLRAAVAAFLAACSPMLVAVSQEARPYPLLAFAYSVAILGELRLMRDFADGAEGRWSSWALFAFGAELTLWAHGLGIFYGICLAGALAPAWMAGASRRRLLRGAVCALAVGAVYAPCFLMIEARAHDWGANWMAWNPSMLLQLVTMYSVMRVTTLAALVCVIVMFLLFKRAAQHALERRGWHSERAMLLLWLGPPALSALISALFVPVFLTRTLAGTLIPACLLVGGAVARISNPRERMVLTFAVCVTLLPSTLEAALRPAFERWDLVASYLERNVAAGDEVWLYPADSALPLERAGLRLPAPMRLLPAPFPTLRIKGPIRAGWPAMVSLTRNQANVLARDPAIEHVPRIWLVTRQASIFDPDNDLPTALTAVRQRGPAEEWGYISVQPFSRRDR
jgi:hypothetical protein